MTAPPPPKIQDPDLVLDVYTHKSIRFHGSPANDEYGNTERLAIIGQQALEAAVTQALFFRRPLLSADEIKTTRAELTSAQQIKQWLDRYDLRARLRYSADMKDHIDSPEAICQFFYIFLGAVQIRDGMSAILSWIGQLVNPNADPPPPPPPPAQAPVQQQNWAPPPPPANPPPPLPNAGSSGMLARFNERAIQLRLQVQYNAEQTGPSHLPVWTVRCVVNGAERGVGSGLSQKQAKDQAARMAWEQMGF
ncbi:hypothetical protein HGRIS_008264 [Hohenbuehelia grisea]|uniref:DRBM domain-containing protein n=1 Tax=Hohenbuehelia grisea TaxID=104357 RepID=A0ABR3J7P9_9AGAR